MSKTMTLNVRVAGPLGDFVAANVSEDGAYENVSEYVRDLIRRDMARAERDAFNRLSATLTQAFAEPDTSYRVVTADHVMERNNRPAP